MIHDPIRRTHSSASQWDRVRVALIAGHVSSARRLLARLIRRLRASGDRSLVNPVLGYVAWIGHPISDRYLENKYGA